MARYVELVGVLCPRCARPLRQRLHGSGRQPVHCADCRTALNRERANARNAELEASMRYCRAHAIDALAWLADMKASGDGCPDCGEPRDDADGKRCAECEAR